MLKTVSALACFLLVVIASAGTPGQTTWELRVCANPDAMPFSNRAQGGFENRIAQALADELGARLTFEWYARGPDLVDYLREGQCDVLAGVPDGYQGLLTTIAYYRSPYVFIQPSRSESKISSLDDPAIADKLIGVQAAGIPPHQALVERGLGDNVVRRFGGPGLNRGRQALREIIEALETGEIDLAIGWGAAVAPLLEQRELPLEISPVTPEFEPPFLSMVFAMAMGVRPGDEALRDRLDVALASRWEEIQAILAEYSVPTAPTPRPQISPAPTGQTLRIGLVVPGTTGSSRIEASLFDLVGDAARMGALLAEGEGREVKVLVANSPSAQAARRAADRLLATEEVIAVIGGLGDGQAEALAEFAAETKTLFLNIGSTSQQLRSNCNRSAFHIEASAAMYLDALAGFFSGRGYSRWFIVHEQNPSGLALLERANEAVRGEGEGKVVGAAAVVAEQADYTSEVASLAKAQADLVLVLLGPADQIAFISQQQSSGFTVTAAYFPHPVTQTRDFIAATRYISSGPVSTGHNSSGDVSSGQVSSDRADTDRADSDSVPADHTASGEAADFRILLWETTLEEGQMGELNRRFTSRWGMPMDPSAWAGYQAVRIIQQAAQDEQDGYQGDDQREEQSKEQSGDQGEHQGNDQRKDQPALIAYLESPETTFTAKGSELSFRPWNHQLRQPLYAVEVDEAAQWGNNLSQMVSFASLAATLPAAPGAGPQATFATLGNDDPALSCARNR